jgi:transposase
MRWAGEFGCNPVFAVEGTGCYGAGLCCALQTAGLEVVEVNRPDRSTRRRLGKDDTIDAEAAARSSSLARPPSSPRQVTISWR